MEQKAIIDSYIQRFFEIAYRNIRFLFFVFILCMIYIWNNHLAQKLVTDINRKAKELKELRWDYLTIKSDLMYRSKLTEVLPRAESIGLVEMKNPPYKITLNKKAYQRQD